MPSNLEIKVAVEDLTYLESIARSISAEYKDTFIQTDTYFNISSRKLKLREFSSRSSQLIYYDRQGLSFWQSDYIIANISDVKNLKKILNLLFDVLVVVKKKRIFYQYENARIHLDTVENLGNFLEFEVVILQGDEQARNLLNKLIQIFSISEESIIKYSYSDLLIQKTNKN